VQRFGVNWLSDHAEAVIRPLLAELSLVFHTNTGEEEEDRPSGGWELTSGHWSHGSPNCLLQCGAGSRWPVCPRGFEATGRPSGKVL